ncbi:50S ribosomal protein L9 [candidate division KSB1 bacterium]|nr:50S ribosomal protein L9 [bacterium]OQX60438.1 MAG: 50S ribosomal protein L9 [candidate division KSB1 bacterium 4484_219]RKY79287.1 MAG: 50S ribosomal protein L9 [candidate division KSB1 bacterium]HDI52208.1 50S ribosomal protein L9 [Bacteroidota bacterium]RKY80139.1 MAG: 50S ribosomal protein L9 [candidate division KSB1 bacterium]
MRVILMQDFESLGHTGEIVEVADGYARNFLIPRRIVLEATPGNMKKFEEEKKRQLLRLNREKKVAEKLAKELAKISCTVPVAVGEEDKIFGSVTSQDIADALKEKGYQIDRRKILLDEPIKALGIYTVPIKLHPEVDAEIKLWVVKK